MTDTPKLPVVYDGKPGRPPYSDAVRKRIVASLKIGCTRTAAYGEAGISETTFLAWLRDIPGFRGDCEAAEAAAERMYTGRLARRAAAGDTRAIEFWLSRRRGANWREKVSVVDEAPSLEDMLDEAVEDDTLGARMADLAAEALRRRASQAATSDDAGGSPAGESDPPA
jgi:hypothetical protein